MNIFKSLSAGNGRILETNATAFISSLFNENDIGITFLLYFIEALNKEADENINVYLGIPNLSIREKINFFKENFSFSSTPEYIIKTTNENEEQLKMSSSIVDIFLEINNGNAKRGNNDSVEEIVIILIENKIQKSANKIDQVKNQYENFVKMNPSSKTKIYSVLISPDDPNPFQNTFESVKKQNKNSAWIKWCANNSNIQSPITIQDILKKILIDESVADIHPISIETKFILKSFLDHVENNYRSTPTRILNRGNVIIETQVAIDNKSYVVKLFERNAVGIFNSSDEECTIEQKGFLLNMNERFKLNLDLNRNQPTRYIGRKVLYAYINKFPDKIIN